LRVLDSFAEVERSLARCSSEIDRRAVAASDDAIRDDALGTVGESPRDEAELRAELRARVALLSGEAWTVLARWYCEGADPITIARGLHRSVRYVYRLRRAAIEEIVELGCGDEFADVDLAEFVPPIELQEDVPRVVEVR
jgi:hypothetical protein